MTLAPSPSAADVLRKALELLGPNGEHWITGRLTDGDGGYCSVGALWSVADSGDVELVARQYLRDALGEPLLAEWNDHPSRTFPEVKAAFLKAILMADQSLAVKE